MATEARAHALAGSPHGACSWRGGRPAEETAAIAYVVAAAGSVCCVHAAAAVAVTVGVCVCVCC